MISSNVPRCTYRPFAIPLNVASVRKGKKKARITEQQYENGPLDDDNQKASEADADHKLGYELWWN